MSDHSTTTDPHPRVADHAAQLSHVRNLLATAARAGACARMGTNPLMLDKAFGHLIREVDDAVDALHGFCFPDQDDARGVQELLALTWAAQHCKAGEFDRAVEVLASVYRRPLQGVADVA